MLPHVFPWFLDYTGIIQLKLCLLQEALTVTILDLVYLGSNSFGPRAFEKIPWTRGKFTTPKKTSLVSSSAANEIPHFAG